MTASKRSTLDPTGDFEPAAQTPDDFEAVALAEIAAVQTMAQVAAWRVSRGWRMHHLEARDADAAHRVRLAMRDRAADIESRAVV